MAQQPTALRHRSVTASTGMTLLADNVDIAVDADFTFSTRDPYAVRVVFSVAASPVVEWVFSRELLIDGLVAPAGTGDVQLFPTRAGIVFELTSPSGRARLVAEPDRLASFVQETLAVVPLGSESRFFDLDREIAMLADISLPDASQS